MLNMFLMKNDNETAMHYAFANKYSENSLEILKYFNKLNKNMLIRLILAENEYGDTPMINAFDNNVLLTVFYYLKDSRSYLMRVLSAKNKKGRTLFGTLWVTSTVTDTRTKTLKYILSTNVALTDKDKFELFNSHDLNGHIPLMYGTDECCFEMLNYFKDNKELLMKLLTFETIEKKT
eukprot:192466_1